jgi:hypothetical protein
MSGEEAAEGLRTFVLHVQALKKKNARGQNGFLQEYAVRFLLLVSG